MPGPASATVQLAFFFTKGNMKHLNKDFLNAKKTAELLCVSRSQIYALAKREHDPLPGKRIGGTLIFTRDNIEAWVERQPDIRPRPQTDVATATGAAVTVIEE